jgi:hypothetical protein
MSGGGDLLSRLASASAPYSIEMVQQLRPSSGSSSKGYFSGKLHGSDDVFIKVVGKRYYENTIYLKRRVFHRALSLPFLVYCIGREEFALVFDMYDEYQEMVPPFEIDYLLEGLDELHSKRCLISDYNAAKALIMRRPNDAGPCFIDLESVRTMSVSSDDIEREKEAIAGLLHEIGRGH